MSLLLDALKKAADDKKKASQSSPVESDTSSSDMPEALAVSHADAETTDSSPASDTTTDAEQNIPELTEELTLDALEVESVEPEPKDSSTEPEETKTGCREESETESLSLEQQEEQKKPEAKSYTVSDEALSMLIYKTNRDVKHNKRIVIFSMLLLSLAVLTSGGVFYYMDMQAEIEMLERKHQIAMQSMKSKTNSERAPEQSEIIRNLVSDSGLDDKVQYAKKHMVDEKSSQKAARKTTPGKTGTAASAKVTFQKTKKTDPVSEKLDEAWLYYDDGRYGQAKKLYEDVLNLEENNRDALLGLGAIAVIEKDHALARSVYFSLLKQDPRDPIAIAALASLQNNSETLEADEKYLLGMLQKNPDAPHLNFALGNIYAQQENWRSAQQSYFNAWQHDVENADYIFNLAVSMDQLGKQDQAVNFYRDSLIKAKNRQVSFSRDAVQKRITELSEL